MAGRKENEVWWQPGGDMSEIAVITALAEKGGNFAIEGEAAGSYPANPLDGPRPALERYRRTFLWIEGRYVLVLDDIRAPADVDLSWLIQSGEVALDGADATRFVLKKGNASCGMQVAATQKLSASVVDSPADDKSTLLGWKQLRLEANTKAIRIASVYDLWSKSGVSVSLSMDGADEATVVVAVDGAQDTWSWTAGEGRFGPSSLAGKDADGNELITLEKVEPETAALIEEIRAVGK